MRINVILVDKTNVRYSTLGTNTNVV